MTAQFSQEIPIQDPRCAGACAWAARQLARDDLVFSIASADASFRRYFRATDERGASWVIMDAPPRQEALEPFLEVAGRLHAAGINAPEIIAADREQGFLLLGDLGRKTFLDVLDAENADELFDRALQILVSMQASVDARGLPDYDEGLLRRELDLYPDWYLARHAGVELNASERAVWEDACRRLVDNALAQPRVFVHRDFMPRNLMHRDALPGVIDFQDAVCGPVTYDLVSLFRDAFISWPEERVRGWVADYRDRAAKAGIELPRDFRRAFDWMGLQRHLKVIGIFARLHYRDGKAKYLAETPRFFRYVYEIGARYEEFAPLLELMQRHQENGQD